MRAESWTISMLFDALDKNQKGNLSSYDLEKLVIEQRKSGSRTIVDEIDLLVAMYDRSVYGNINYADFEYGLTPRLQG